MASGIIETPEDDVFLIEDDFDEDDGCDHDDYDADILTGRAMCHRCGHAWWQTAGEIEREARHQAAYQEWVAEQERPWNRFKEWLSGFRPRFRRRTSVSLQDDEIPF